MAPKIREAGGELVVIGSGTPAQAKQFAEEERVDVMVTDPTLEAYRRAGMKRSLASTLLGAKNLFRALSSGHMQGMTKGDSWQQGGVVVVSPMARAGQVVMQHASSEAGDPTDFAAVVTAVERAARLA